METTRAQQIAKTILSQIKMGDAWFLPAIGAKNLIAMPESKDFAGGLRFACNGLNSKVKYAVIMLRWVDTYTVSFLNKKGDVVKTCEDVYCDELVQTLDYIEGR
jgi:hypothetical protein